MAFLADRGRRVADVEEVEAAVRALQLPGAYVSRARLTAVLDGYGWRRVAAPRNSQRPAWYTNHPDGKEAAAVRGWPTPTPRRWNRARSVARAVTREEVEAAMDLLTRAGHHHVGAAEVGRVCSPPARAREVAAALTEAGYRREVVAGSPRWVTNRPPP